MSPRWPPICMLNRSFGPAEGAEFFRPFGWRQVEFHDFLEEGRRRKREVPLARFGRLVERVFPAYVRRVRERYRSGMALMERTT